VTRIPEGRADLTVGGLRIWVHGLERVEGPDSWLVASAEYRTPHSVVRVEGPLLDLNAVERLMSECRALYRDLKGRAVLASYEQYVQAELSGDGRGHLHLEVNLSPGDDAEDHVFRTELDQTYLPDIVADCEKLLQRYGAGWLVEEQGVEQ